MKFPRAKWITEQLFEQIKHTSFFAFDTPSVPQVILAVTFSFLPAVYVVHFLTYNIQTYAC